MHGRLTSLDKRQHVTHSDSLSERANSYHVVHLTWLEHSVRSKPAHTWSWWSRSNLRGGSIAGSYVMIKMLRTLQFFADDDDQNQEHTSSFWLIMIITISVLIALKYESLFLAFPSPLYFLTFVGAQRTTGTCPNISKSKGGREGKKREIPTLT